MQKVAKTGENAIISEKLYGGIFHDETLQIMIRNKPPTNLKPNRLFGSIRKKAA